MFKRLIWLPIAIVIIGVGVYFAIVRSGPETASSAKNQPAPTRTTRQEVTAKTPSEPAAQQPGAEEAPAGEARTDEAAVEAGMRIVAGTILDEKKAPIANAKVVLLPTPFSDTTAVTVTTDNAGGFRFVDPPPVEFQLVLKRPPHGVAWLLDKIDPATKTPEELRGLEFTLEAGRTWAAVARNKEGAPLEGVSVRIAPGDSNNIARRECERTLGATLLTDKEGLVTFHQVETGNIIYTARLKGSGVVRKSAGCRGEPQKKPTVITLVPGGTIRGTVLDPDGRPAPGAKVESLKDYGFAYATEYVTATTESNDKGEFTLTDVPEDRYLLVASLDGFSDGHLPHVRVVPDQEATGCTITLERSRAITGRVVDTSGDPVGGARITLDARFPGNTTARDHFGGIDAEETTTAADGTFRLTKGTAAGGDRIRARKEGYMRSGSMKVDGDEPVTIILTPCPVLVGTVTAAETGEPVEKATVHCLSGLVNVETDANGQYRFSFPYPQRHTFTAYAPGLAAPSVETVQLDPGETTELNFALEPSTPITGVVLDKATGEPIEDASVWAVAEAPSRSGQRPGPTRWQDVLKHRGQPFSVRTDERGSFSIPYMLPELTGLRAETKNHLEASVEFKDVDPAHPLRIELDHGASIAGRVWAPDGTPLSGAGVSLRTLNRSGSGQNTDQDGRFRYGGLLPGSYTLAAHHGNFTPSESKAVEVEPGEAIEEIELTLGLGGRIAGTVTDEKGTPVENATVSFAFETDEYGKGPAGRKGETLPKE